MALTSSDIGITLFNLFTINTPSSDWHMAPLTSMPLDKASLIFSAASSKFTLPGMTTTTGCPGLVISRSKIDTVSPTQLNSAGSRGVVPYHGRLGNYCLCNGFHCYIAYHRGCSVQANEIYLLKSSRDHQPSPKQGQCPTDTGNVCKVPFMPVV